MTDGLSQAERTLRVLELLGESAEAHLAGERSRMSALIDEALEVDDLAVSGIRGGILIGEIPSPTRDPDAYAEYVAAVRDRVASEVTP